jgi:hypothetical protein
MQGQQRGVVDCPDVDTSVDISTSEYVHQKLARTAKYDPSESSPEGCLASSKMVVRDTILVDAHLAT